MTTLSTTSKLGRRFLGAQRRNTPRRARSNSYFEQGVISRERYRL